jgi:hypothetical protein
VLARSNSDTEGTQTAIANNMLLGRVTFNGSDGTAFQSGAFIAAASDGQTWASGDCPARLVFSTTADGASSPTERMRITQAGRVGINETAPAGLLHISKSAGANTYILAQPGSGDPNLYTRSDTTGAAYHLAFNNPNGMVGRIETSGSSTSFVTASDYRLKENVVPLTGAADRLNNLQVHRFNFIADPNKTVDGFIAHEAQAVVPECVTGEKDAVDDEGNPIYQGIDQSKLVPLLTAALQEAIAEIASLTDRVAALEAQ